MTGATAETTAGTAPEVAAPPVRAGRHLYQVDVVRLLTFACVVGVHTTSMAAAPDSVGAGALLMALHFTRDAFFLLSSFVLFHVYARREVRLRSFWGRRFLYIGVPYLAWTVVYWVVQVVVPDGLDPGALRRLGTELLLGTGQYHLYFLLVSMQLYLVFPALLWLVRRTAGHHGLLLAGAAVFQVVVLSLVHWGHATGGWGALQAHAYVLFPTYLCYFVAGGLAAVHLDRFHAWVVGHSRAVAGLVVGAAVVQGGAYAVQLAVTGSPVQASDPLQPTFLVWSAAVTAGFYALGCAYARSRRAGSRPARAVDQASLVSFGVYLVHPLFLNTLLGRWLAHGATPLPAPVAGVLAWAGALTLSAAFAAVAVRTPAALALTGRRRLGADGAGAAA